MWFFSLLNICIYDHMIMTSVIITQQMALCSLCILKYAARCSVINVSTCLHFTKMFSLNPSKERWSLRCCQINRLFTSRLFSFLPTALCCWEKIAHLDLKLKYSHRLLFFCRLSSAVCHLEVSSSSIWRMGTWGNYQVADRQAERYFLRIITVMARCAIRCSISQAWDEQNQPYFLLWIPHVIFYMGTAQTNPPDTVRLLRSERARWGDICLTPFHCWGWKDGNSLCSH